MSNVVEINTLYGGGELLSKKKKKRDFTSRENSSSSFSMLLNSRFLFEVNVNKLK